MCSRYSGSYSSRPNSASLTSAPAPAPPLPAAAPPAPPAPWTQFISSRSHSTTTSTACASASESCAAFQGSLASNAEQNPKLNSNTNYSAGTTRPSTPYVAALLPSLSSSASFSSFSSSSSSSLPYSEFIPVHLPVSANDPFFVHRYLSTSRLHMLGTFRERFFHHIVPNARKKKIQPKYPMNNTQHAKLNMNMNMKSMTAHTNTQTVTNTPMEMEMEVEVEKEPSKAEDTSSSSSSSRRSTVTTSSVYSVSSRRSKGIVEKKKSNEMEMEKEEEFMTISPPSAPAAGGIAIEGAGDGAHCHANRTLIGNSSEAIAGANMSVSSLSGTEELRSYAE